MMKIYYKNHLGEILNLLEPPYMLQTGDFFDYKWNIIAKGNRIRGFKKELTHKKAVLSILNYSKESYFKAVDKFTEIVEKDVLAKKHGKLFIGDMYLECFVTSSKKSEWENDIELMDVEVTFSTDRPLWVEEKLIQLMPHRKTMALPKVDFPFDFPFDFADKNTGRQTFDIEHFSDNEFLLIFYGPATNPEVRINGNSYKVYATLLENEFIEINSRNHSVIKHDLKGNKTDLYNSREFRNSVFKKIPSGAVDFVWDGNYGIDILLYLERSDPKWSYNTQM